MLTHLFWSRELALSSGLVLELSSAHRVKSQKLKVRSWWRLPLRSQFDEKLLLILRFFGLRLFYPFRVRVCVYIFVGLVWVRSRFLGLSGLGVLRSSRWRRRGVEGKSRAWPLGRAIEFPSDWLWPQNPDPFWPTHLFPMGLGLDHLKPITRFVST